ncbi:Hypothetical protein I5071_46140 [Sandaracinus amylolyticus]|nr:Hypothetical protein I5071_46140 [Sandaracinus amylolyticus]
MLIAVVAAIASSGCVALLGPRNARRAGLVEEPRPEPAPALAPAAPDADLHPVIFAYRESLRPFLGADEQAALDAIDWAGTARGDAERLRFLAADHAIRRVLPLVLEAEGSEILVHHAERLRALPPLLNRDTDVVQRLAVIEAMVALEQVRRGIDAREPSVLPVAGEAAPVDTGDAPPSDPLTDALARLPRERTYDVDPEGEAAIAEALAEYATEYARVHGVSELHGAAAAAAAADMVDVAFMLGRAMQQGVGRERLFEEALAIADGMCSAARRGERLPRLHREERPPSRDDAVGSQP